jgi:GTP-binding protein EngB required for normal cell division/uncharacterized protein (DUF697 family)
MSEHFDPDDIVARVLTSYEDALRELGRFNLIVLGDTGAGKSTLINEFFGIDLAETGIGRSVTKHIQRYMRYEDDIITVYDNRGFEVGAESLDEIIAELNRIVQESRVGPTRDQIHAVWFVVNPYTSRFLDSHIAIVRAVHELGLPVAIVFTRVHRLGDQIDQEVLAFARKIEEFDLPIAGDGRVIFVNSRPIRRPGASTIPVHGLHPDLLQATLEMAPAAARAIKAAQKVNLSLQRKEAKKVIRKFRYVAAPAGAVAAAPIPLADVGAVILAMATMIAKISACYALPIRSKQVAAIATAAVLGVGAGQKGATEAVKAIEQIVKEGAEQATKTVGEQAAKQGAKQGAKQVGKLIPLVNLIIGAVGAGSAMILATAVGHAWMHVCEYLLKHPRLLEHVDIPTVLRIFQHYFKARASSPPGDGPEVAEPVL